MALMFIILLSGAFLRLYRLGDYSFWFDEAASLYWSDKFILADIWKPLHPSLLYFWFLHFWRFLGNSEFALRLSSVIFGVGSLIGIYYLGKLFFDKKTAVFSAFLLAISPFHIYYSQELRMYSLISFLSIMSAYFLFKALANGKNIFWAWYIIFSVLGIYAHPMFFLILLAQCAFFIIYIKHYNPFLKKWLAAHAVILACLIPWLKTIIYRINFLTNRYGTENYITDERLPVFLKNIIFTFKNFSIGYNATNLTFIFMFGLFIFLFVLGVIRAKKEKGLILALCCLVIPIFAAFLIAKCGRWFYVDRYLICSSVFFCLIVAEGLSSLKKRYSMPISALIIIFSTFALGNYYKNYFPDPSLVSDEHRWIEAKKDWRSAANYILDNFQEGDVVLHTCKNTTLPLRWYLALGRPELIRDYEIVLRFDPDFRKPMPYAYDESEGFFLDYSKKVPIDGYDRVWLVVSWWGFDPHSLFPPVGKIVDWMDGHYTKSNSREFDGGIVCLYTRPQSAKVPIEK